MKFSTLKFRQNNSAFLLIIISISLIVLIGFFLIQNYYFSIEQSEKQVLQKLKAIACTASVMIDYKDHKKLETMFPYKDGVNNVNMVEVDEYLELHSTLKVIQEINKLKSPVYTMVYDSTSRTFQFIGTSSSRPYFRHTYEMFPSETLENYENGGTLPVYYSENGKWLSAFAPILNEKGKSVGLIQIDQQFDDFILAARSDLLEYFLITLIIVVPGLFLLLKFINRELVREQQVKEKLMEQNEEIQSQNDQIQFANNQLHLAKIVIEKKNKELDQKVKERTHELWKANHELGEFLYRSSHDVQGPVTTLLGLTYVMKTENIAREYAERIERTASTLLARIKSINAVYEIKNKQLEKEKIGLKEMVDEVLMKNSKEIDSAHIKVNSKVDSSACLTTDKRILQIATDELIKNSIQYRSEKNSQINIEVTKNRSKWELTVDDNGPGVPNSLKKRIFTMFQRANENSEGSGLGLYAIKLALERIGGRVKLEEKETPGARFTMVIPGQ